MPGGPDLIHDLVEPDVRGLQRLIENVEAGSAHFNLLARTPGDQRLAAF
jgi:hypothetical protein